MEPDRGAGGCAAGCPRRLLFKVAGDGHKFEVMAADKVGDFGAHIARIEVGLDALESVEHRRAALVHMAVSLGDVVDLLLGEAVTAEHHGVDAEVGCRVVGHDDEGGHIAADAAAALDQSPFAYVGALVEDNSRRENHTFVNHGVAGNGHAVAYHAFALDAGVVAYMGLGHDERVAAYAGASFGTDAAVDDHMLADHVVVADVAEGLFAVPAEVLGVGADYGVLIDFVVLAHAGASDNACVGHYLAAVADLHIGVDIGEGMDGDALSYFGRGVDVG